VPQDRIPGHDPAHDHRAEEHETCAACGFDGAAFDGADLLDALSGLGAR
jgi:hypothetical protein